MGHTLKPQTLNASSGQNALNLGSGGLGCKRALLPECRLEAPILQNKNKCFEYTDQDRVLWRSSCSTCIRDKKRGTDDSDGMARAGPY